MRSKKAVLSVVIAVAVMMGACLGAYAQTEPKKAEIFYAGKPDGLKDAVITGCKDGKMTVTAGGKNITIPVEDLIKIKYSEYQPMGQIEYVELINGDKIAGKLVEGPPAGATVKLVYESKSIGKAELLLSKHVKYYCNQPAFKNAEDFKAADPKNTQRSFKYKFIENDQRDEASDYVIRYDPKVSPPRAETFKYAISEITKTEIKGYCFALKCEMNIARENSPAFVVKKIPFDEPQNFFAYVRLMDGTEISGTIIKIENGTVQIKPLVEFANEVNLPMTEVQEMGFRNGKMENLSDKTPLKAEEHPFFSKMVYKWQQDRMAVSNAGVYPPLKMDGKQYQKGIGVHAYSKLEYDLKGQYANLIGVVGVDDSGNQYSNFVAIIMVDGKEVFKQAIKWGDKPVPFNITLNNSDKLELIIDFGENLDVGDRADWGGMMLIKK